MKATLLVGFVLCAVSVQSVADSASPYAGQEARAIKALSPQEIQDYLAGKGMGFAKSAELNRYPGPAHVLELADKLVLTPAQLARTRELFQRMQEKAIGLGRSLVDAERDLDTLFADRTVTPVSLQAVLERIGGIQIRLRQAHLEAHLEQTEILMPRQVARYIELRGYNGGAATHSGQGHAH